MILYNLDFFIFFIFCLISILKSDRPSSNITVVIDSNGKKVFIYNPTPNPKKSGKKKPQDKEKKKEAPPKDFRWWVTTALIIAIIIAYLTKPT